MAIIKKIFHIYSIRTIVFKCQVAMFPRTDFAAGNKDDDEGKNEESVTHFNNE